MNNMNYIYEITSPINYYRLTDDSGGINISSHKDLPIRILYMLILKNLFMMIKYNSTSKSNPARGKI